MISNEKVENEYIGLDIGGMQALQCRVEGEYL